MRLLLLFVLASIGFNSYANEDSLKAQLIRDWQRAKEYTRQYLETMPADKYQFRAHDSIRSFAEQMLHLAQGNVGLSSNGTGAARIWPGRNLEKSVGSPGKDSVVYYVMGSYDYIISSINALDASKLFEKVKRGNFDESRLSWILKAYEHQNHHRGQTTIYIRLLGLKPPNELLF